MTAKAISPSAKRALSALGANIKLARLKRRISVAGFAERVGVSESTVMRLEKGDSGVGIGTLVMAWLALGEIERISGILDPGSDDIGLLLDRERLPKRIDRKRGAGTIEPTEHESGNPGGSDNEGIGF